MSVLSLLWVSFLARGVFTKLEHRRTVLGPLVGWWAICSGWLHVRVSFGCWVSESALLKGGRDSSPRLAGYRLGSYGALRKLVFWVFGGGVSVPRCR